MTNALRELGSKYEMSIGSHKLLNQVMQRLATAAAKWAIRLPKMKFCNFCIDTLYSKDNR